MDTSAIDASDAAGRHDGGISGRNIESLRSYLLLVAERAMSADLKTKEGASDLVQEAFLEAHRNRSRFSGEAEGELKAWLRRLLLHKVAHAVRRYRGTKKRTLARETSVGMTEADTTLALNLAADETSPAGRAVRNEEAGALLAALDRLPERMRHAVLWRQREACSFEEIGRRLGCSDVAAGKLWTRALRQLQVELKSGIGRESTSG